MKRRLVALLYLSALVSYKLYGSYNVIMCLFNTLFGPCDV